MELNRKPFNTGLDTNGLPLAPDFGTTEIFTQKSLSEQIAEMTPIYLVNTGYEASLKLNAGLSSGLWRLPIRAPIAVRPMQRYRVNAEFEDELYIEDAEVIVDDILYTKQQLGVVQLPASFSLLEDAERELVWSAVNTSDVCEFDGKGQCVTCWKKAFENGTIQQAIEALPETYIPIAKESAQFVIRGLEFATQALEFQFARLEARFAQTSNLVYSPQDKWVLANLHRNPLEERGAEAAARFGKAQSTVIAEALVHAFKEIGKNQLPIDNAGKSKATKSSSKKAETDALDAALEEFAV